MTRLIRSPDGVVMVGAGPVGLATAIGLRRWGVPCTVLEKHAAPLAFPKGRGVSARTMEIFRQWGIEEEVTAAGLPRQTTEHLFIGETLLTDDFQRFDAAALGRAPTPSPSERMICAQDAVEAILLRHALDLGANVLFAHEVTSTDERDGAALLAVGDGDVAFESAYAVACDGGRSPSRARLRISTDGPGPVGSSVSILFHADLAARVADRLATIYKVSRPHPSAFFAVVDNDRRWLLMMARDPAEEPEALFTEAECIRRIHAALGDPSIDVDFRSRWFFEPTASVAGAFRAGRIFLAGDAAHQCTPFGAMGMNCGIADAHNLAWKLAAVLQGWGGDALLESYEAERRPVAQATTDASVLRADVNAGPPRAAFDGVTLGYGYTSEVIAPDGTSAPENPDPIHTYLPTARPGHRAPHVVLGDGRSTLDLFGEHLTLLTGTPTPTLSDFDAPVRVEVPGGADWHRVYGVQPGGLVLVRPDGHVAWRSADRPGDGSEAAIRLALDHAIERATGRL